MVLHRLSAGRAKPDASRLRAPRRWRIRRDRILAMWSTPSADRRRIVGRAVDHLSCELTRRTVAQRLCAVSIDIPTGRVQSSKA